MKIAEDPWDNYLYFDSKFILPLVCHSRAMPIERQVLLTSFLQKAITDETISMFKLSGQALVDELMAFVEEDFVMAAPEETLSPESSERLATQPSDDDDDEDDLSAILGPKRDALSLLAEIRAVCLSAGDLQEPRVDLVASEMERALKMFFLQQEMQGNLKEFKEDYFV